MKIESGFDSTLRGIRPELRFGLLIADFILLVIAVEMAKFVGDLYKATQGQLSFLVALLFVTGAYVQWRYESARTFDFHDVLRLLYGAAGGTVLALACIWLITSPLAHESG